VTAPPGSIASAYADGLSGFLLVGGEGQLRLAYELGRRAVTDGVSVLELSEMHHDAMLAATAGSADAEAVRRVIDLGRAFLGEALSAYEMVGRGFRVARDDLLAQRYRAAMLRGLAELLLDGAPADATGGPADELALILAEQARELCEADACLVTLSDGVTAAAHDPDGRGWAALLHDPRVRRLDDDAPAEGLRLETGALAEHAALRLLVDDHRVVADLTGWIVAPLRPGGRGAGAIQLFTVRRPGFGPEAAELADHLARLTSAGVERWGGRPAPR
jgi:hypothetical protein